MGTRFLIDAVRDNHKSSLVISRSAGLIGWRRQRAIVVQLGEAAPQRRDEKCADLRRCRRDSMALPIVPSLVGRLSFGEELTRRRRGGLCLPEKDPLYPKCISPDLLAILIQKDDAKSQGIRANPRQKNRATWQGQR